MWVGTFSKGERLGRRAGRQAGGPMESSWERLPGSFWEAPGREAVGGHPKRFGDTAAEE